MMPKTRFFLNDTNHLSVDNAQLKYPIKFTGTMLNKYTCILTVSDEKVILETFHSIK